MFGLSLRFPYGEAGALPEAERAYRAAITAGIAKTYVDLGTLLMKLPGREGEAVDALFAAKEAGMLDDHPKIKALDAEK